MYLGVFLAQQDKGQEQKAAGKECQAAHEPQKQAAAGKDAGKMQARDTEEKEWRKEIAELKETLQRVQADFENTCKRAQKEKEEWKQFANAVMAKELLGLLDSMDAGIAQLQKQENVSVQDALGGLQSLRKQLFALLQAQGLREIRAVGEKFDPMLHDAAMQCSEKGKKDCEVLEELQKGYLLNGRVLRHSKVKVNRLEG